MIVRPMQAPDEAAVRALYAGCHAAMPDPPAGFFFVNPTLVAASGAVILGMTVFSLNTQPDGSVVMIGRGVSVDPRFAGRGVASELLDQRVEIARANGATRQVVATDPGNAAMIRAFERQGLVPFPAGDSVYPDGSPALAYIGDL